MAVYTKLTTDDLTPILARYSIGTPLALTPIAAGTANTNYMLSTETGRYVCTLFEVPEEAAQMVWLPQYLEHLSKKGLNVATIVADQQQNFTQQLAGKMMTISRYVRGSDEPPHLKTAEQAAHMLANMHLLSENYPCPVAQTWAPEAMQKFTKTLDKSHPLYTPLMAEPAWQQTNVAARMGLPQGVIHADYFADNVLFEGGFLSGVIDFYKAGLDAFAYDLAMALTAWGFDTDGNHTPKIFGAFYSAYNAIRPLSAKERAALPELCRRACCVILAMRLGWLTKERTTDEGPRPPEAYAKRLAFFQNPENVEKLGF